MPVPVERFEEQCAGPAAGGYERELAAAPFSQSNCLYSYPVTAKEGADMIMFAAAIHGAPRKCNKQLIMT